MASPASDWLTGRPGGVRLSVKVRPRATRTGVQGVEADGERTFLVIRVAAPPEGGKANAAVMKLLARHCGVAAGALSLVSGAAGRRKLLDVRGEPDVLMRRLRSLAGER